MKNVEYKVKVTKTGEMLKVLNDGHHFRAFTNDKEALQKSNAWVKLEKLLDEVGGEICGAQGNGAGAEGEGKEKEMSELEKLKIALELNKKSFEDNLEEFKNTYQNYPEAAREQAESFGCDFKKLKAEVELSEEAAVDLMEQNENA